MSLEKANYIRCPSCDMLVDTQENRKFLPFCSSRCRLIDLGRWLNEEHTLPCEPTEEEEVEETSQASPRLPPGWHDP
jgi:endogenous inhibitor of DNA gyrase (YacG/DUF329 family)